MLTGKAQSAYAAMRAEDALDYRVMKKAILKRYEISEDSYRQKFRRAEKKAGESVSEMAVRLNDVFRKWTRSCTTVEQLADLMVKEQLLNTLPMNVKIWVEERRPGTAEEAAQLADDYFRARKQAAQPFKPSEGKTPMESQSARRWYMCKQTGHVAKDCPSRKSEGVAAGKSGKELEPNGGGARQPVPVFREKRDWTKVRSSRGNKYVLVVCDYATRYPEAIAMRSVEAERVAEELVTLFARVGIPEEILMDQGTNFTSRLLKELYRLLHIRHNCTSRTTHRQMASWSVLIER